MYLFFDTETTGKENRDYPRFDLKHWPRMVQIGWLLYDNSGKEIVHNSYIIKPEGFTIPDDVVKIHGITTDRALKEGILIETALKNFCSTLDKSEILAGHNIEFYVGVVDAEFRRKKLSHVLFDTPKFCTMKEPTIINYCKLPNVNFPDSYKWPSLPELHHKLFGKKFQELHNALNDAEACARCFFELKKLGIIKV